MSQETIKTLLNIGAGGKNAQLPPWFAGWEVIRLDIDPQLEPDIVMDAREIGELPGRYDAVFCSHNLEHYTRRDAGRVIHGMRHILKSDGFADIYVPDIGAVMQAYGENSWDLDTFVYQSAAGPITVIDMLFGFDRQIEFAEHPEFMQHKTAFSGRTLSLLLKWCGFIHMFSVASGFDLRVVAFNQEPDEERLASVGLGMVTG